MNKNKGYIFGRLLALAGCVSILAFGSMQVKAEGVPVTTVEELNEAMMNAADGDTILVGDITFTPMPMGMVQVPKNLTIKSGKDGNAVFTNATFALNGSSSDASPSTVRFEGIDFQGDNTGNGIDVSNPPNISSKIPGIMSTMCCGIFKMNLDVTYADCSFTGYHYGYGGVFNAIYSSDDNKNELKLTLENCSFKENAGSYGGALYLIGKNHNITFSAENCVFDSNAAATGGAVWAEDANVTLKGCRFSGNDYIENEVTDPVGGALALYNCAAELDNCVLENNRAGKAGGGIFCRISPFYTLIMRNCTVNANQAETAPAVSVVQSATNFSMEAKAYLYFTSIANHSGQAGNDLQTNAFVTLTGALLADESSPEQSPSAENGYCLSMSADKAKAKGIQADATGRILLPAGTAVLPEETVKAAAGGRFAEYAGLMQPGHNDLEALSEAIRNAVSESEGEGEANPEDDSETVTDDSGKNTAAGRNGIVLTVLVILLLAGGAAACCIVYRRKSAAVQEEEEVTAAELPDNWIDRVCEKPEIKELLSNREMEVFRLLLAGQSREQIARTLFISESTVKKHSSSIYAKLNVSGKADLIATMAGK